MAVYCIDAPPARGLVGEIHVEPQNAPGMVRRFSDGYEHVYLRGVVNTAIGDAVVWDSLGRTLRTTLTTLGPVAIAQAAVGANDWGWYRLNGTGAVTGATIGTSDVLAYASATPGTLDDAVTLTAKAWNSIWRGGSAYGEQVIADGASAYWPLNETTGLTAVDVVGGVNGTISGGVTLAQPGALADGTTAMLFDSAGDYVSVPNGSYAAIGTGPLTVECWLKPTSVPATTPFVIENSGGANGAGFAITFDASNWLFKIANGTTSAFGSKPFTLDGQWHHVVGVLTRGTPDKLQLFVDGVAGVVANPPANGWNLTSPRALLFGTYSGGEASPDFRYFGLIDEVAIYPVALTPAQIAAHYALRTTPAAATLQIAPGGAFLGPDL